MRVNDDVRLPFTKSIALTAAETGHLVFSTLHTVGAAKTIDRIVDMFPSEQQQQVRTQLSTVCEGVVSQQLIKTIDGRKRGQWNFLSISKGLWLGKFLFWCSSNLCQLTFSVDVLWQVGGRYLL